MSIVYRFRIMDEEAKTLECLIIAARHLAGIETEFRGRYPPLPREDSSQVGTYVIVESPQPVTILHNKLAIAGLGYELTETLSREDAARQGWYLVAVNGQRALEEAHNASFRAER